MIKLKSVVVKESVPFQGPADVTLLATNGELMANMEARCVIAKHPKREPLMVPFENIRYFVELTPEGEKKAAAALAVANQIRAVPKPVVQNKGDTVKFERGPDGKVIEKTV